MRSPISRTQRILFVNQNVLTRPLRSNVVYDDDSRVSISTPRRRRVSSGSPASSSCARAALRRVRAFRMPPHASRPTLSSCKPRLTSPVPVPPAGIVTPSDGGTNPGGGALIAEGAMRDWRMCASDERMATCIDLCVCVWPPSAMTLSEGGRTYV